MTIFFRHTICFNMVPAGRNIDIDPMERLETGETAPGLQLPAVEKTTYHSEPGPVSPLRKFTTDR